MKIIVTATEVEHIVRKAFSPFLQSSDELEIVGTVTFPDKGGKNFFNPSSANFISSLMQVILVEHKDYQTTGKILAIKKLREYVPGLGLAAAKFAIETPDTAIARFFVTGEWQGFNAKAQELHFESAHYKQTKK